MGKRVQNTIVSGSGSGSGSLENMLKINSKKEVVAFLEGAFLKEKEVLEGGGGQVGIKEFLGETLDSDVLCDFFLVYSSD